MAYYRRDILNEGNVSESVSEGKGGSLKCQSHHHTGKNIIAS